MVTNGVRIGSGTPFPPFIVEGSILQLWIRGDRLFTRNGGDLQQINDGSGFGRNYRQLTASKQPAHKGITLNGRQAIGTFNGSTDALTQFEGSAITDTTYTMLCVGNFTVQADGTSQPILDYETGRMNFLQQMPTAGTDDTGVFDGSSLLGGADAVGGTHSLTFSINGASSQVYRDMSTLGSTFDAGSISLGNSSSICSRFDGTTSFLNGTLGEILLYAPVLSASARTTVWDYMSNFWAL